MRRLLLPPEYVESSGRDDAYPNPGGGVRYFTPNDVACKDRPQDHRIAEGRDRANLARAHGRNQPSLACQEGLARADQNHERRGLWLAPRLNSGEAEAGETHHSSPNANDNEWRHPGWHTTGEKIPERRK